MTRAFESLSSQIVDRFAEVWQEWTKEDAKLGAALGWCAVEDQIEVGKITLPHLPENYVIYEKHTLALGPRYHGSQRSACDV